jgi:hypothetical protein
MRNAKRRTQNQVLRTLNLELIMKTSNKLLLAIFLSVILLTTTVQLMVYAKYKRGEYVKFKREEAVPMARVEIPAVRFISIKGLGYCSVLPGDKLQLEMEKEKVDRFAYRIVNDTLVIIGDTLQTIDELQRGIRNYNLVNIYVPATVQINGTYSSIKVGGAADSASAPSYTVRLQKNSHLYINNPSHDKAAMYFNQLNINSEQSKIELDDHSSINDLNVQLTNSRIDDKEAVIKKLTLDTDSTSTVTLSGKNIKALK